jgi:hypothetical protein
VRSRRRAPTHVQVPVCGVPGIARAVINITPQGKYELLVRVRLCAQSRLTCAQQCEGTGLRRVLGVPGIAAMRTSCNHVVEVNRALGIEAARVSIQVRTARVRLRMYTHTLTPARRPKCAK